MKRVILRHEMIYPNGKIIGKGTVLVCNKLNKKNITFIIEKEIPEQYLIDRDYVTVLNEIIPKEANILVN